MRPNQYHPGRLHQECAAFRLTHETDQDADDRDPQRDPSIDQTLLYITTPEGREIVIRDGARGPRRIEW